MGQPILIHYLCKQLIEHCGALLQHGKMKLKCKSRIVSPNPSDHKTVESKNLHILGTKNDTLEYDIEHEHY